MSPGGVRPDEPVSVVIPVYDRAAFLEEAVTSVLAQDHELEVVIVDDGSTDGTGDVADRLAAHDPRVRALHQPNAGAGAARNAGLRVARHRLAANHDSDDLMLPGRLQRQVGHLADHPELVAVMGRARIEVMPGTSPPQHQLRRYGGDDDASLSTLLFHRGPALEAGGYAESRAIGEDTELLVRLAEAGHRFGTISETLSVRRFHDHNTSAQELDPKATLLDLVRGHLERTRDRDQP